MLKYLIRRLLLSLPILFGITVITFGIIHLTPGGFTSVQINMNPNISPDSTARLQELYDLEQIKKHMSSAILHDMVGVKGYITWGDYRFDIVLHSKLGTPESSA